MNEYIFLMHNDVQLPERGWDEYLAQLSASGQFDGGSSIGSGVCVRKNGVERQITQSLSGYIRVRAASLNEAKKLLVGNPVFEAGGNVEIRELPRE